MHKKKEMLKLKNSRGITLIALIITIIILLILTAVTLNEVNGQGIIYHAKRAAFVHDMKSYQEQTKLLVQDKQVQAVQDGKDINDIENINVGLVENGQHSIEEENLFKIANKYKAQKNEDGTIKAPEQVIIQTVLNKEDNTTKTTKMYYHSDASIKDNADHVTWCKETGIPIWPDGCNGTPTDPNVTIPTPNPEDGGDYPTIDKAKWKTIFSNNIDAFERDTEKTESQIEEMSNATRVDDETNKNKKVFAWIEYSKYDENGVKQSDTVFKWWSNSAKVYLPEDSSFLFTDDNGNDWNVQSRYIEEDESNYESNLKFDFQYFDSSKVKTMKGIFKNSYAKEIDLSKFDTSNVTDMSLMFCDCYNLKKINLSNINTKNVTNMSGMFFNSKTYGNTQAFGGSKLESLDLSNFNTSNVTDMSYMFAGCSKLTSLDLSKFDTSRVTDMSYMFAFTNRERIPDKLSGYTSIGYIPADGFRGEFVYNELTSINLSSFNTRNVTNMESMFEGCVSLKNLNLKKFNTSNVTNMSAMFAGCDSLTSLDLSSFDTSNVLYMQYMFYAYGGGFDYSYRRRYLLFWGSSLVRF